MAVHHAEGVDRAIGRSGSRTAECSASEGTSSPAASRAAMARWVLGVRTLGLVTAVGDLHRLDEVFDVDQGPGLSLALIRPGLHALLELHPPHPAIAGQVERLGAVDELVAERLDRARSARGRRRSGGA